MGGLIGRLGAAWIRSSLTSTVSFSATVLPECGEDSSQGRLLDANTIATTDPPCLLCVVPAPKPKRETKRSVAAGDELEANLGSGTDPKSSDRAHRIIDSFRSARAATHCPPRPALRWASIHAVKWIEPSHSAGRS